MTDLEETKRRLNQQLFHLTNLSFVKMIHIQHAENPSVRIDTAVGSFKFGVRLVRSYLDRPLANDLIQIVKGVRGRGQSKRTADFAVRVFSLAIIATVPYCIAVSKLRLPFLSAFFIAVRPLRRREKFTEADFALLARAFNRVIMGLRPTRSDENRPQSQVYNAPSVER
jgi:hypothetical protein